MNYEVPVLWRKSGLFLNFDTLSISNDLKLDYKLNWENFVESRHPSLIVSAHLNCPSRFWNAFSVIGTKKGNVETPKKNDVQNEYFPMKEN